MRPFNLAAAVAVTTATFSHMTATPAEAINRGRRVVRTVQRQFVELEPVQTLFLVAPPSFYAAPQYTPPALAKAQSDKIDAEARETRSLLLRVTQAVSKLEGRIDQLEAIRTLAVDIEQSEPVPPAPDPRFTAALDLLEKRCAKCHANGVAKGDFQLGQLGNGRRRGLARALVDNAKMPVDADGQAIKLPAADRQELIDALDVLNEVWEP